MASSSSSSHSAPASSSRSFKYDVFLSFRGEDTRKTFVDHLYSALQHHLIGTYKDDETLPRGESIRPSLFKAIEESRIAVIVFSKNYADSSWCLEELAHIMKCKEERELIVMPIFYDVDPSDVRKQKGDFGRAFAQQEVENTNKAQLWRNALVDASNIAGWEPKYIANGHESKAIKKIVRTIKDRLSPSNLEANEDLVGMTTRIQYLKSQLEIGSDGVRMVGIWGVGGGGKTTLASSLYMGISCYFEGHHIIDNIREESSKYGLKKLQENMLSALSKTEVKVHTIEQGKRHMISMLCRRKVLVVLDDVDELGQLEALAGSHSWFGSGSRVIITTRNEHLLRTHKVDTVCDVKLLSDDEAMQLFNRHAYNVEDPIEDYETLSLRVVSYAAGLPLALKVLGSFLYDKEKKGWMSTLERLKDIPETEIVEKLKISYDGLKNVEKELFLDIACFWRWNSKVYATEILEACGFHPEIGIEVLRQKALITVSKYGNFNMHDLVQEMGHYIVRGEHPNNPDKHSRIWKHEEINNLTMENNKIEAIKYEFYDNNYGPDTSQFCKSVSKMKKLRYLTVWMRDPKCVEGPIFLSNELRYIKWEGYPARVPFPHSFQPIKLVVLKLQNNFQKEVWKGCKHLPHLKVLELIKMKKLLRTPDFDGLPCLQELTLFWCSKLKEIHPSLGNHNSLQYVSVSSCPKVRMFPTIVSMKNLKSLKIGNCDKIVEFPNIRTDMESLVNLSLSSTGIEVFPSSIGERCTNLISLYLSYLENLKSIEFNFDAFKHLKELTLSRLTQHVKTRRPLFHQFHRSFKKLDLYECRFKYVEILSSIIELSNLEKLDLSCNDFSRLDCSISQFTKLKFLNLWGCKKLLELPELPSSLNVLNARYCRSLTTFGDCHKNCRWLGKVSLNGGSIIKDGDRLLESMLEACMVIENHYMLLELTGHVDQIPKLFPASLLKQKRCTLQLPENWCYDFSGFLFCVVFSNTVFPTYVRISINISMNEEMNGLDSEHDVFWEESTDDSFTQVDSEHDVFWEESADTFTRVAYVSFGSLRQTVWWNQTYNYKALSFKTTYEYGCYGFGVRLIDKKSKNGPTETSTNYSSDYTPTLQIEDDSVSALSFSLSVGFSLYEQHFIN